MHRHTQRFFLRFSWASTPFECCAEIREFDEEARIIFQRLDMQILVGALPSAICLLKGRWVRWSPSRDDHSSRPPPPASAGRSSVSVTNDTCPTPQSRCLPVNLMAVNQNDDYQNAVRSKRPPLHCYEKGFVGRRWYRIVLQYFSNCFHNPSDSWV